MHITRLYESDFHIIWPFFEQIVRNGRTYALPADMSQHEASKLWCSRERAAHVVYDEQGGTPIGTFYIRANMPGPGSHIANGGVMVNHAVRGQGYGRKIGEAMLRVAQDAGYRAIQFNNVVETNVASLAIWEKLGFQVIGKVPEAFHHPDDGYIGAYILYKQF